jgi:hypothetical protein
MRLREATIDVAAVQEPHKCDYTLIYTQPYSIITNTNTIVVSTTPKPFEISNLIERFCLLYAFNNCFDP